MSGHKTHSWRHMGGKGERGYGEVKGVRGVTKDGYGYGYGGNKGREVRRG